MERLLTHMQALCILLSVTALLAAQAPQPNQDSNSCMVRGDVTNQSTGEPLSDVTLRLESPSSHLRNISQSSYQLYSRTSPDESYTVTSSTSGNFCFLSIKAGVYELTASKDNFLTKTYGALSFSSTGKILTVSGEGTENLTLSLNSLSGISGKVVDEDLNPIIDANVVAVKQLWIQGHSTFVPVQGTQSDAKGEYRIGKLTPGQYYVYAQPSLQADDAPSKIPKFLARRDVETQKSKTIRTYYPRSISLSDSLPVSIFAGEDLQGVTINVLKSPTYHIRGRLRGQKDQWQDGSARLLPLNEEPIMVVLSGDSNVSSDGTFDLANTAPGAYTLNFRSPLATAQVQLNVKDSDLNVDVPLIENGMLVGKVFLSGSTTAGPADMSNTAVTLMQASTLLGLSFPVRVSPSGDLAASNIPSGEYLLKVATGSHRYLESLTVNGAELSTARLSVLGGSTTNISIKLREGLADVSGSIEQGSNGNRMPFNVFLVPLSYLTDGASIYATTSDKFGHFAIGGVTPGIYRALATESFDSRALQNPATLQVLMTLGTEVQLKENQSSYVNLSAIREQGIGN